MKLNLYYSAAVVHVFIVPTFGLITNILLMCSKFRAAFNNVHRRILNFSQRSSASTMYANKNFDSFKTLLRKRTFGFIERLEKRENSINVYNYGCVELLEPDFIYKLIIHIDGHESKPAISILAIVQESRKTSAFRYFLSYSFYFIT